MQNKETDKAIENSIENVTDKNGDSSVLAQAPKRNTTFAHNTFNTINYGGVNFVANSSLSLWITYNVLPTKAAQKFISGIANVIKPIVAGWGKLKGLAGFAKEISQETRKLNLHESARSTAEILCMCIAGTVILLPMKWLENHKEKIVEKIDRWRNRSYHKHCKEHGVEPEPLPHEDKEKQTWKDLISARVIGVMSVLGIDAVIQNFNNKRVAENKSNFDTAEWKMGGKIYDKLPKSISDKFINFFSAKKAGDLSGLQKPILERLEKAVGNDHKRMIFAEQTRLFTKEVSLTAVLSVIMFGLAKTGVLSSALNKLGFKKEKEQQKIIDDILPDVPLVPITRGQIDLDGDGLIDSDKKYTDKIKPVKKETSIKQGDSFTHKYNSEIHTNAQLGV